MEVQVLSPARDVQGEDPVTPGNSPTAPRLWLVVSEAGMPCPTRGFIMVTSPLRARLLVFGQSGDDPRPSAEGQIAPRPGSQNEDPVSEADQIEDVDR